MTKHVFHCDSCQRNLVHVDNFTTGYGIDPDTKERYCFQCCGDMDRAAMADCKPGDKFTLYLTTETHMESTYGMGLTKEIEVTRGYVSNWPGTLKFKTSPVRKGSHNIARNRYDVRFKDHTGAWWWGVQYGDYTQVCHCTKLKHPVA